MKSKSKLNRLYGWKPELPGRIKHLRSYSLFHDTVPLPSFDDLTPKMPPVYDQGQVGSCVGNGVTAVVHFIQPFLPQPSRLFTYYNARIPENDTDQDGGAQICDGVQGVVTYGVIPETEWPYDPTQVTVQPNLQCYTDAKKDLVTNYFALNNDQDIKQCLFAGFPVVFGMTVYESFESDEVASTGIVPMPTSNEQSIGGHCMVIVGYDDANQQWIVRNSWGTSWGQAGYCRIPYGYIDQFASDFWTVRADTDSTPSVTPGEGGSAV
jgi:C1A family cysteine protease